MSLTRRIRTATTLSAGERALAIRASVGLAVIRVALPVLGFARLLRAVQATAPRARRPPEHAEAVRRAVSRAVRTVPGSRCIAQAVLGARLLREAGLPATITIGVADRGAAPVNASHDVRPLDAHAWVRSGEIIVSGAAGRERYATLTEFVVGA